MVAVLKPVKPSHRDDSDAVSPCLGLRREPGLEGLFGAALDHCQQPAGTRASADGGKVNDHGDVLVPTAGVTPHVLINPDNRHRVETAGLVDEQSLSFSQNSVVGGVPRHPERNRDPRHGQVVDHQRLQRPP